MRTDQDSTEQTGEDIRPVVASGATGRGGLIFAGVVTFGAALLFYTLENRRASSSVALTSAPRPAAGETISSPPDLRIPSAPQVWDYGLEPQRIDREGMVFSGRPEEPARRRSTSDILFDPNRGPVSASSLQQPAPLPNWDTAPSAQYTGSAVVYDAANVRPGVAPNAIPNGKQDERVTATRFQNPSTTIPKGTVIQAVLETALDSTRPGFARAIVSRDVFGFDGTEILIPKGSRLVGEYKADLAAGQNRALIQWQRLMRPDGVMINIDSPAADPLGRAGVPGKVDSHFLERFGGAILQSALDIGVRLATSSVSRDAVILALPGNVQGIPTVTTEKVQPTLKVHQGTSVSVFVSRDLDFSTVTQ